MKIIKQTRMFIKLTLICLMIVPLIFGEDSENPAEGATTRVGKFFGLFAGKKKRNKMTLLGFLVFFPGQIRSFGDSQSLTRIFYDVSFFFGSRGISELGFSS